MEAAGSAVASFIIRTIERRPVSVLCGPGNNGGDGFVVARKLKESGWIVRVGLLGEPAYLKGDAALMAGLYDGPLERLTPSILDGAGLIIDAMFGTGLSRAIESPEREIILAANDHAAPVVSLDMPSGVDADSGAVLGVAIKAAATVTFIARKPGHLLFPGRAYAGAVQLAEIGVKDEWIASVKPSTFENHPMLWAERWRRPTHETHKYDRGHAAIVSGPRLRTGAARLAAISALRAGAGLVTMLSPTDACDENASHLTAIMLREADNPASIVEALKDRRFTAALIGPAAGVGRKTAEKVMAILNSSAAAILDADALTSFGSDVAALFALLRTDDILTPHSGEFSRLFPLLDDQLRLPAARAAAAASGAVVVLKGADTVIAAPDGRAVINSNAPYDLATAGAGDVLAGIITGMRAQGLPGLEAAASGVWIHGAAGQFAGTGLIAEDLPDALPLVFKSLFSQPAKKPSELDAKE